jgi:hypothetical protein
LLISTDPDSYVTTITLSLHFHSNLPKGSYFSTSPTDIRTTTTILYKSTTDEEYKNFLKWKATSHITTRTYHVFTEPSTTSRSTLSTTTVTQSTTAKEIASSVKPLKGSRIAKCDAYANRPINKNSEIGSINNINANQFHWLLAYLNKDESQNIRFVCVGTLISNKIVLSASYCFQGKLPENSIFLYGQKYELNLKKLSIAKEFVSHPDLAVAVAILYENNYDKFVKPICFDLNSVANNFGEIGTVVKWKSADFKPSLSLPHYVNLKVEKCKSLDAKKNICATSQNYTVEYCSHDNGEFPKQFFFINYVSFSVFFFKYRSALCYLR